MEPTQQSSKGMFWAGWIITILVSLFLLLDGVMKLFKPAFVVDATKQLGYPESVIIGIGVALVVSTLLYLFPRTAVFGAILLTGYLGGAVATHVRMNESVFNVVFATIFGAVVWLGLWFRDARLRALLPFSS